MNEIIVASSRIWDHTNGSDALRFDKVLFASNPDELMRTIKKAAAPEWIFFTSWQWMIPDVIISNYNCVVFHMTDLPFGRGGSPLQNLIERKIYKTKITAFKPSSEMDAGDILLKKDFDISAGSAEKIYRTASHIIFFRMIPELMKGKINPVKQEGEPVIFKRRKPAESNLFIPLYQMEPGNLHDLYDFIRMLDAEGYPRAFICFGDYKIEFSNAEISGEKLTGSFTIR